MCLFRGRRPWHMCTPSALCYNLLFFFTNFLSEVQPDKSTILPNLLLSSPNIQSRKPVRKATGSLCCPRCSLVLSRPVAKEHHWAVPIDSQDVSVRANIRGMLLGGPMQFVHFFDLLSSAVSSFCISCQKNYFLKFSASHQMLAEFIFSFFSCPYWTIKLRKITSRGRSTGSACFMGRYSEWLEKK